MKLTKSKLKQIIKEELQEAYGSSGPRLPYAYAADSEGDDWHKEDNKEREALELIQKAMTILAPIRPLMIDRLADVTAELRSLLGEE